MLLSFVHFQPLVTTRPPTRGKRCTMSASSVSSSSPPFSSENFSSQQEISFTRFKNFLNQGLVLSSSDQKQTFSTSLADLLNSLSLSCGYLKGSSVERLLKPDAKSNKKQEIFKDIDFQFVPPEGLNLKGSELEDKLCAFVMRLKKDSSIEAIKNAKWFRTVCTEFKDSWAKRIVTLGYPKQNCTTVDLNFTTQNTLPNGKEGAISYDMIAASDTIYFDLKKEYAAHVSVWSPILIGWMRQKKVCWFNTAILHGLQRLSYRISKNPDLQFIQPGLAQHFFEKATQEELALVGRLVLADQYKNSNLSQEEQAGLWLAVLDSINQSSELESNNVLQHQMLVWTDRPSPSELRIALESENQRQDVCESLTNCAKVSLDFKKSFHAVISLDSHFKDALSACLNQAMGFRVLSACEFFSHVYGWKDILMVPDKELKKVFGEYLDFLTQNTPLSEKEHAQATHMKGWLVQHPVQSAHFWLDQIPEKTFASPASGLVEHLMFALSNSFNGTCPQACDELIPRLLPINFGQDATNYLICEVLNVADVPVGDTDKGDLLAFKTFFHLFIALDQFNEDSLSISNSFIQEEQFTQAQTSYVDLKNKIDVLKTQVNFKKLPLLLRHNLSKKGGLLAIDLPGLKVTVSADSGLMIFESKKSKVYLSPHLYGISAFSNDQQKRTLKLRWSDGTYFNGYQNQGEDCCVGRLFYPFQQASPQLQCLIELGHKLCLTVVPEKNFSDSRFKTEGEFSFQGLFDSNTHDDAVRALRKGFLNHYCTNLSWCVCCKFENGSIQQIDVQADNWQTSESTLQLIFKKALNDDKSELAQQWGVVADIDQVCSKSTLLYVPGREILISVLSKWDPEKCERLGQVDVYGEGAIPFKWEGQIEKNKILSVGKLYGNAYTTLITFKKEAQNLISEIPIGLMPVMVDLLSANRATQYPFKSRIWQNLNVWPEEGFEGFVYRLGTLDHHFTGYLMATGKAVGVLEMIELTGQDRKLKAIRGSFLLDSNAPFPGGTNASKHPRTEITVCNQNKRFVPVANLCDRHLRPHGFCLEYTQNLENRQELEEHGVLYFNGYAFPQSLRLGLQIMPYNMAFESHYCNGSQIAFTKQIEGEQKRVTKMVELFFNAKNGGSDCFFSRPSKHLDKEKYNLTCFNATGFAAEFQVKKQADNVQTEIVSGNLYFTCDVTYSGKICTFGKSIQFNGLGNLWMKNFQVRANFHHEGKNCILKDIKAMNRETEILLKDVPYKPGQHLTLESLLNKAFKFGPSITYGKDILPHLLIRDFSMFKNHTLNFS